MSYENKAYILLKDTHGKANLVRPGMKRSPRSHTSVYNVQIGKQPFGHKESANDKLLLETDASQRKRPQQKGSVGPSKTFDSRGSNPKMEHNTTTALPNTGRIASPNNEFTVAASGKLIESPEMDSYQKIYNFLNNSGGKASATKLQKKPENIRAVRPMSQAGFRIEKKPGKADPEIKLLPPKPGKMQNKRSKSSCSNSIYVPAGNSEAVYKIYAQTKPTSAINKRRRTENKSFVGSYQPAIKGQFLPSPNKRQVSIRSPSPCGSSSDAAAYAALKSSLTMMCARKSESKIPIEAWADPTRNKKTPPSSSNTAPTKRPSATEKSGTEHSQRSKQEEYNNFLENGITPEMLYNSNQKKGPIQTQFFASQHRKLSSRDKKGGGSDLLSKSQMAHRRNDSNTAAVNNAKPPVSKPGKPSERPKTPTLGKIDTRPQAHEAGKKTGTSKKQMGKTFHAEYQDNAEDYVRGYNNEKLSDNSSIDMKKVIAFLHSPPSSREPAKFNPSEPARTSIKNKHIDGKKPGNNSPQKMQSQTERAAVPAAFMKRFKASNLVTHANTFEGVHRNTITCMCTSEGTLWAGSKDRTITIWNYLNQKSEHISTLLAHTGAITTLCQIPMSELIASGSEDSHVKVWSTLDKTILGSFRTKNAIVECIVAKDPTQILCGASNHSITAYDLNIMAPLSEVKMVTTAVPKTLLIPQGNQTLFAGFPNGVVEKFDLRKPTKIATIEISRDPIAGMVTLDHNSFIVTDVDGVIKEIDMRNNSAVRAKKIKEEINCLSIIKPGCLLVGTARNFQILDVTNQMNVIYRNEMHQGSVKSICYSENDRLLFTGGYDQKINMFQLSPCI